MVVIHNPPDSVKIDKDTLWFELKGPDRKEPFSSKGALQPQKNMSYNYVIWTSPDVTGITQLDNDIRFDFNHSKSGLSKVIIISSALFWWLDKRVAFDMYNVQEGLFHFWINTRMLKPDDNGIFRVVLTKMELDKARKDTTHEKTPGQQRPRRSDKCCVCLKQRAWWLN
mgnify:CR=1 FL=1